MTREPQVGDLETLGDFHTGGESCARAGERVTSEHFICFVTDVLNERFPDAWIGRGGPIPWPPRSQISLHLIFSCGGTLRTLCMLRI